MGKGLERVGKKKKGGGREIEPMSRSNAST